MGYDTSFHPVDVALLHDRVLPYIAGHGADDDIDDLVQRAVRLRRVRFRAKSWALGVARATRDTGVDAFDSMLHVWGRPFFIVADEPDEVADLAVRYLNTPLDGVDDLAREMVARLDPALVAAVRPDTSGTLPDDAGLTGSFSWRPRVLRSSVAALRAGETTLTWNGEELKPADVLAQETVYMLLHVASFLVPGWMSRGRTWPTYLLDAGGLPEAGFGPPDDLLGPLAAEFPQLPWTSEATIIGNYMVGGYVAPAGVPATRTALRDGRDAIISGAEAKLGASNWALELRKIDEALALAQRLGVGFCEATEVYSGMTGSLN
ncbi:hypothetical protein GCM10009557_03380 [Virgisporangium ochraceum]|uniref:Uncharacterized protein n=1 Tax=Virgisporangium ochraceum TaxID=65505 RepID=A0A8J3ZXA3_9ACTN|nr:hypothetical protein [Virgisporangium ochraceum]GIJ70627.1 hypothetical protein Voc01_055440 [Virgisporangium ochraceum]